MRNLAPLATLLALVAPAAHAVPDACDAGFGSLTVNAVASAGDVVFQGGAAGANLGTALANVGDFDGDGIDDLAIGVPGDNTNGSRAGAVDLYLSDGAAVNLTGPAVRLFGPSAGLNAGAWVAAAGDVDGDGRDDLLVGSTPSGASAFRAGVAWLVAGVANPAAVINLGTGSTATLVGAVNGDEFGSAGAGVGDIDGDGFGDLAIGAPGADSNGTDAGAAFVFTGPLSGTINAVTAEHTLRGVAAGDRAGHAVVGLGDVDSDTYDDFAVAAPAAGPGLASDGAVYVLTHDFSPGGVFTLSGAPQSFAGSGNERLGWSLARAGDTDGDDADELWIGARQHGSAKRGAVYLVEPDTAPASANAVADTFLAWIKGHDASDFFGTSVHGDVDLDGDGFLDAIIGADRADGLSSTTGAAYVVFGPFSGEYIVGTTQGRYAGDTGAVLAGAAVAMFEDLNADGFGDIVFSSPRANPLGRSAAGAVSVFYGGADTADLTTFYLDGDADGWGGTTTTAACSAPPNYVAVDGDCDDGSALFHPYAQELNCGSPVDYSCDGSVGAVDLDEDGVLACENDCDDGDATVAAGMPEYCGTGKDEDCNGAVDDSLAVDAPTWRPDLDGDSFGSASVGFTACVQPSFFLVPPVTVGGDCDDGDTTINPSATEVCDAVDNDCDGTLDGEAAIDALTFYEDDDGDGYGLATSPVRACAVSTGVVASADDCDDTDDSVHPGALESCDFIDNDCDGLHYRGGPIAQADATWSLQGPDLAAQIGDALAITPDTNGDGRADLVLGAPGVGAGGAVYVLAEPPWNGDLFVDRAVAGQQIAAVATIRSSRASAQFGAAIAGGDFDGDGIGDLAIGAPGSNQPSLQQGAVFLFFGPLSGELTTDDADGMIIGVDGSDRVGAALASAELFDGAPTSLLIGAPGADLGLARRGAVAFIAGGLPRSTFTTQPTIAEFPTLLGAAANDELGTSVAFAGDTVGDGFTRIAAAAPLGGGSQKGYVALAPTPTVPGTIPIEATLVGAVNSQRLGRAVAGGDFTGDGIADLAASNVFGRIWVVPGPITGNPTITDVDLVELSGPGTQELGATMVFAGDANADGFADLAVGAPGDDEGGRNAGAVYLIYGSDALPAAVAVDDLESFGRLDAGTTFPTYSAGNYGTAEGAKLIGAGDSTGLGAALIAGFQSANGGNGDLIAGAPGFEEGEGLVVGVTTGGYGLDVESDGASPWSRANVIDGSRIEWDSDTEFTTGDGVARATVTWDETDIYLGSNIHDVATGGAAHWFVAYLGDGDGVGANVGVNFNTQHPGLPFAADYMVQWNASNTYASLNTWNGSAWVPNTSYFTGGGGAKFESNANQVVEFRIERSALGDPDHLDFVSYWLYESNGFETSYAALPADSFVQGSYDPDPSTWYPFDLTLSASPSLYEPIPSGVGAPGLDGAESFWPDRDLDGFSDPSEPLTICRMHAPQSFANPAAPVLASLDDPALATDCDDSDATVYVGAPDPGGDGIDQDCDGIDGGGNLPPTVTLCDANSGGKDRYNLFTGDTILVDAAATDPDGDPITLTYLWYVNGVATGQTGPTFSGPDVFRGNEVSVECVAADILASSPPVMSNTLEILNAGPMITDCTLGPDPATGADALVVSAAATDPEGDTLTWVYAWNRNFLTLTNTSVPGLDASFTARDDLFTVQCQASDPFFGASFATSNELTISNTPPTVSAVTITADTGTARRASVLTCDVTAADGDGDPLLYVYAWTINGAPAGSGSTLSGSFLRDDVVGCSVVATDGVALSDAVSATAVTIQNTAPALSSVSLTFDVTPLTELTTVGYTTSGITDDDGDAVTLLIEWLIDSVPDSSGTTITGARFDKFDVISARVTPTDGLNAGTPVLSDEEIVENSPPTAPVIELTPRVADTNDDVHCEIVTPATDPDPADTVGYLIFWTLDGVDWTSEAITTTWDDDTIPAASNLGGTFDCEVTAYDDEIEFGPTVDTSLDAFEAYERPKILTSPTGTHFCAVLDDDSLKCWGGNGSGQLGQGNTNTLGDGPGEMGDALLAVDLPGSLTVEMATVGGDFTCALLSDGQVYCWGANASGQLGISNGGATVGDGPGEMGNALTPVPLTGFVRQIESGDLFTCAVKTDDTLWCWGANASGQLGQGNTIASSTPVQINLGTGRTVKKVGLGNSHACAILDNNAVKCWGLGTSGQLGMDANTSRGDGPSEMGDSLPAAIIGATTPVFVDGGALHSCVMYSNNGIRCWGGNAQGQLGRGNNTQLGDASGEMATLTNISVSTTKTPRKLVVNSSHNCVQFTDNTMKCWGNDDSSRLGYATPVQTRGNDANEMGDFLPVISFPGGVLPYDMAGGFGTSCAVTICGDVHCWGRNAAGQMGLGNTTAQVQPSAALSLGTNRYLSVDTSCTVAWSHTITIDGDPNDWFASEIFTTSAGGGTETRVTWDDTYIYIGTKNPDVATGGSLHWFVSYFGNGTGDGLDLGITFETQEAVLAAPSQTAARWKADNSFSSALNAINFLGLQYWNGNEFYFVNNVAGAQLAESNVNQFMEYRIRRDELYLTNVFELQSLWLYEGAGFESSYAATPSTMFTNGTYDPDHAKYFRFDLTHPDGPAAGEIRDALP